MYYDLHIHSALSPCSDDSMTIHNIINMSLLKGLDLIAITDHNSLLQQDCFLKAAKGKIAILIGVEIQTSDKVHVLGYFPVKTDLKPIQRYLDQHLFTQMNQPEYYGNQLILDENDRVVMVEDRKNNIGNCSGQFNIFIHFKKPHPIDIINRSAVYKINVKFSSK